MCAVLYRAAERLWVYDLKSSYHRCKRKIEKHTQQQQQQLTASASNQTARSRTIALARETTTSWNCEKNWIEEKQIPVSLRWSQTVWQHFTAHFYAVLLQVVFIFIQCVCVCVVWEIF